TDEEAITQLLLAESEAVVQQDIERLAELWSEDAMVTDANHTPDDAGDDAVWRGIDAVLDRYVVLVFPGNPQFAAPEIDEIVIVGDMAWARSTTRIGSEVSPGGDQWTFVRREGRWYIQSLTYNLEPP
ncbi:MAG: nuclear transport factor 2 family protein, partial [Caldilineae bacterium]